MTDSYLLKIDNKLKIVSSKRIDTLSATEIMAIGICCVEEQRKQLISDAIKGDKYFYGRRIVDALELSIKKLEEKIPDLRDQAYQLAFGKMTLN